jgi:benzil reductase ((S)-benzoin forming)
MSDPAPLAIVTGATGGIGAALIAELADRGCRLLAVGRNPTALSELRERHAALAPIEVMPADLGASADLDGLAEAIAGHPGVSTATEAVLFNCAGTIAPIAPVHALAAEAVEHAVRINVVAPTVLTAALLRARASRRTGRTTLVQVSSGAGLRPVSGWAAYCVSKAALNMLAHCVAAEAGRYAHDVRGFAVNPGATDTGMQQAIRDADPRAVPSAAHFRRLFADGQLRTPSSVAARLVALALADAPPTDVFVDFNTMAWPNEPAP